MKACSTKIQILSNISSSSSPDSQEQLKFCELFPLLLHYSLSKVGVIGAGVSGIAGAKHLSHQNPIVFEASDSIGGVWRHCSYNSTKLQLHRRDYEFSDFPWFDRNNPEYPFHLEILDYLNSYAEHFDVLKFVKFNSKVVEVRFVGNRETVDAAFKPPAGQPAREVAVQSSGEDTIQWYTFEFLVVFIGKYGDIPRIPEFPPQRPSSVSRSVMHSLDYCKLDKEAASELLKDKKVVVVGYKKSALDLAVERAEANQGPKGRPCTMVVRTLHWMVPHYWVWGLPFFLFYSTRASQFLHPRPNQSFLRIVTCLLALSPLKHAISKIIESYILWKLPLEKYGLKPDHPFEEDYASCQMAITPENLFSEADKGRIMFKRSEGNWRFYKDGIEFDDGSKIDADVVVLATGYDGKKKLKAILPEPFRSLLESGIPFRYYALIQIG